MTSDTAVVLPEAWQQRDLRHGSGAASDITMSLPQTLRQTPRCHLAHRAGVTSVPTGVLLQTWWQHHLSCYHRHGGNITSGAATNMAAGLPQPAFQLGPARPF